MSDPENGVWINHEIGFPQARHEMDAPIRKFACANCGHESHKNKRREQRTALFQDYTRRVRLLFQAMPCPFVCFVVSTALFGVIGFCFGVAGVTRKAVTFPFQHVRHLWHDLSRF
jgi:hypothetical protein